MTNDWHARHPEVRAKLHDSDEFPLLAPTKATDGGMAAGKTFATAGTAQTWLALWASKNQISMENNGEMFASYERGHERHWRGQWLITVVGDRFAPAVFGSFPIHIRVLFNDSNISVLHATNPEGYVDDDWTNSTNGLDDGCNGKRFGRTNSANGRMVFNEDRRNVR